VSTKDLELRERLNRPVIKVMQRHPGNQMPEAQYIVRVSLCATFFTPALSAFISVWRRLVEDVETGNGNGEN